MADAYLALHPGVRIPPSIPQEYPKWITAPDGRRLVVQTRDEEWAVLDGAEPPENPKTVQPQPLLKPIYVVQVEPDPDMERAALQVRAVEMGIQIDRRWGVKKLKALIEGHR